MQKLWYNLQRKFDHARSESDIVMIVEDESLSTTDWSYGRFAFLNVTSNASADSPLEDDLIRSYINFPNKINLPHYANQTWLVCCERYSMS